MWALKQNLEVVIPKKKVLSIRWTNKPDLVITYGKVLLHLKRFGQKALSLFEVVEEMFCGQVGGAMVSIATASCSQSHTLSKNRL